MDPLEVLGKGFKDFAVADPFNDNELSGYISHESTDRYGSLLIERVNGELCPQLILCTPKIPYPFDRNMQWRFPAAKRIERYEKLDGTNVFAYRYHDTEDNEYVTYKTRLLPVLGNSRFGPFLDMVKQILQDRSPSFHKLPISLGVDISYELWGYNNMHLVRYDKPLELSILFARRKGNILPPSAFDHAPYSSVEFRGKLFGDSVDAYKTSQESMESNLKFFDDGYYSGVEGEVWYILTENGRWALFKCKPETIEKIHWSRGGLGKNQIVATCENALENWDEPTIENIVTLLLEDFDQDTIDRSKHLIKKYLEEVIERHKINESIIADYQNIGVSILADKPLVMRTLSKKYPRNYMRYIYSVIMRYETN